MTASDPRVGEIQARLPDEVWTAMPSLTDDSVIMHRVYDDEGHCIAECSNPDLAEFIAAAPADVAYILAQLSDRDERLARVDAIASGMDKIADFHMEILGHKDSMAISLRQHAENLRAAVAAATGDGQ